MPWQGVLPVDLRLQFMSEYLTGLFSMTDLATQYGISRKTGYKWVERYEAGGPGALHDRSLLKVRQRHPRWGAKKLLATVKRQAPTTTWPSRSTVCDLLRRHGMVVPRRRRRPMPHGTHALAPIPRPNATWTTDFKGEFRTGDRVYCYPLTLRDGFSRYVRRCDALLSRSTALTRGCFERAFRDYGLPDRIRSDNGEPFASPALGRLSRLSVWWMRLGIVPERIALGRPEQNGSHEQFHSVLKAETARTRPARLPPLEYAGHLEIRRVGSNGCVGWRGQPLFLTEVLGGEEVGFEEIDDGIWTLYFASVRLGRLNERTRTITALPTAAP